MPTCPNGHQSVSEDWCEVCGHRMAAAPSGAPAAPSYGYGFPPAGGDATAQAELCPQCRTPREAMAPFCEECRYNFLTGAASPFQGGPPPVPPVTPVSPISPGSPVAPPPGPPAQPSYGQDPYDYQGSRPSQVNRPAEALGGGGDDWLLPPPGQQQVHQPRHQVGQPQHQAPHQGYGQPQHQQPQHHQQHQPQHPQQQQPFPAQAGPARWSATIAPDRSYFMAMMQRSGPEAVGLNLPAYSPEQHLPLSGEQITIGRRRASTGESPDIDLSVPPEDPGVSHQHAVLVQQPDGSWAVVDQNSTNGTTINGGEEPIQPYVPVPLADGDRVHVGAWTTITVRRG
ncbi:FHA domain-containing protein [Streptomyces sp. NPDC089799]|uniref:FHA domain-containing protein n=1 Tax=Streptomyces sp. NPDC089799 TaxID=3155066 RepID=UPI00343B9A2D